MNESTKQPEAQAQALDPQHELPRVFSAFSTLSLAFSITNSWIGYSAVFVTPLLAGGGPGVIYCLFVVVFACFIITAGLAEVSSAYPSSGGQYHIAFMIAPERSRAGIAFLTGWLSVLAWLFTSASACIFCAQICIQLASLFNPMFEGISWQVYLIYVLIMCICAFAVVYLGRWIPLMQNVFFVASLLGFVVFTVTVLAVSPNKQSGDTIFVDWKNLTGWGDGVVSDLILDVESTLISVRHSSSELDRRCIHLLQSTALPTSQKRCRTHLVVFLKQCGSPSSSAESRRSHGRLPLCSAPTIS